MSAYPFYKDPRLFELHKRLILHIHSSNFTFALPQLNHSTWNLICGNSGERDRLEFIGDRIISALIAEELYRIRPNENPKFYTNASTILVANSTFAHIMHKLGYHDITTGIKPAGDAFETVMAAYKQEVGKDTFEEYARVAFEPLIRVVCNTYDDCARSTYYYNYKNQMRVGSKYLLSSRSWKKSKAHPIPRSMLSSGKRKPVMPIIIDLTSDDDDEQVTVTNLSQVSYSKGKLPPGVFSDSAGLPLPCTFTQRIPNTVASEDILRYVSTAPNQTTCFVPGSTMSQPMQANLSTIDCPRTVQQGTRHDPICLD